jgi:H+/Cl- antiporter ClcA
VCDLLPNLVARYAQDDAIRALFSSRTKREYTVPALVLFVSAFFWLSVLTTGMFCPTGLFVPSILCGAAYGRLVRRYGTICCSMGIDGCVNG